MGDGPSARHRGLSIRACSISLAIEMREPDPPFSQITSRGRSAMCLAADRMKNSQASDAAWVCGSEAGRWPAYRRNRESLGRPGRCETKKDAADGSGLVVSYGHSAAHSERPRGHRQLARLMSGPTATHGMSRACVERDARSRGPRLVACPRAATSTARPEAPSAAASR